MPGPRGVITVNGNTERSLRTEEHNAALAAEAQTASQGNQPIRRFKARTPSSALGAIGK